MYKFLNAVTGRDIYAMTSYASVRLVRITLANNCSFQDMLFVD